MVKPFEDGFRRQYLDREAEPPPGLPRLAACGEEGRAVAETSLKIAMEKPRRWGLDSSLFKPRRPPRPPRHLGAGRGVRAEPGVDGLAAHAGARG